MSVLVVDQATPESVAALGAGVEEARRRGEDLVVVSAAGAEQVNVPDDVAVTYESLDERDKDPVGAVLDVASKVSPSVIVIGIKRRTPTGKMLFGSTAQRILLEANSPVLAVKSD